MEWQTIEKPRRGGTVLPNLADYEQTQAAFSWEAARRALSVFCPLFSAFGPEPIRQ